MAQWQAVVVFSVWKVTFTLWFVVLLFAVISISQSQFFLKKIYGIATLNVKLLLVFKWNVAVLSKKDLIFENDDIFSSGRLHFLASFISLNRS